METVEITGHKSVGSQCECQEVTTCWVLFLSEFLPSVSTLASVLFRRLKKFNSFNNTIITSHSTPNQTM